MPCLFTQTPHLLGSKSAFLAGSKPCSATATSGTMSLLSRPSRPISTGAQTLLRQVLQTGTSVTLDVRSTSLSPATYKLLSFVNARATTTELVKGLSSFRTPKPTTPTSLTCTGAERSFRLVRNVYMFELMVVHSVYAQVPLKI